MTISNRCFSLSLDCFKTSKVNLLTSIDLEKIKSFEIRGQWSRFEDIKEEKLTSCDLDIVELLIKSQEYFLSIEVEEYDCMKKNKEIVCEEILIDECCILNWRLEEIRKWKSLLNKKGRL
jgi:hypothetical protein